MSPEPQRSPVVADVPSDGGGGASEVAVDSNNRNDADVDAFFGEAAAPAPPQPQPNLDRNKALELEIFGGDSGSEMSEMEEMSSDEEEDSDKRTAPTKQPSGFERPHEPGAATAAEEGTLRRASPPAPSDEDSDEYLEHASIKPTRKRKKRSAEATTKISGESAESDVDAKAKKPKKTRRKSTAEPGPDVPFEQMTKSQQAEIIVGREFDEVLAAINQQTRRRKAEKIDEAELDEMMVRLREDMKHAAFKDSQLIERKEPALEKLKMLPVVQKQMQKTSLYDQFIDNNILEAIKLWLEPLPDGSLPSIDIVTHLFEVLKKMPITTDNLRESGLGRIIKFYTLVPEERITSKLHRQAELLVAKWTRPIMQRSANYRDRHIRRADEDVGADGNGGLVVQGTGNTVSSTRRLSQATSDRRSMPGGVQIGPVDVFAKRPAHSRSWKGLIPQPVTPHYRVAPPNQIHDSRK